MFYGRNLCRPGGAGKAERAKLPSAGIGWSGAQGNARQKKPLAELNENQ
jgi:hypothetical protein